MPGVRNIGRMALLLGRERRMMLRPPELPMRLLCEALLLGAIPCRSP